MKNTLNILLLLFISWNSTVANPTDKTSKTKENLSSNPEKESSKNTKESEDMDFYDMELKVNESEAHNSKQNTVDDPDSSYYSVNKFNYLFYYLYKVNYLESDEDLGLEP